MQELSINEVTAISGGLTFNVGGWNIGYDTVPGGGDLNFSKGATGSKDFGNGWSLDAGFNSKETGFEVKYVW